MSLWDTAAAVVGRATRRGVGVSVTHTPTTGTPSSVKARFDRAYVSPLAGITEVAETRPTVWLLAEDLATPVAQDDTVTVAGTSYTVTAVQPDGEGMSRCYLVES